MDAVMLEYKIMSNVGFDLVLRYTDWAVVVSVA
ncbi:hypothetical protein ES703_31956 [subsurface metagenome]